MAMTSPAFDTHKAVKTLQKAGADETLAEAVVATIGTAIGDQVATKADLNMLEQRLTIRLGGLVVVGVVVLASLMQVS